MALEPLFFGWWIVGVNTMIAGFVCGGVLSFLFFSLSSFVLGWVHAGDHSHSHACRRRVTNQGKSEEICVFCV